MKQPISKASDLTMGESLSRFTYQVFEQLVSLIVSIAICLHYLVSVLTEPERVRWSLLCVFLVSLYAIQCLF